MSDILREGNILGYDLMSVFVTIFVEIDFVTQFWVNK